MLRYLVVLLLYSVLRVRVFEETTNELGGAQHQHRVARQGPPGPTRAAARPTSPNLNLLILSGKVQALMGCVLCRSEPERGRAEGRGGGSGG